MGGKKMPAAPTAQMTVTLTSFPVGVTADLFLTFRSIPQLRARYKCICWWKFVFKNKLFCFSVKPSQFFTETDYSINTSDFRFSYASLLLPFIFQKYRRRKVDIVHKFDINLVS